MLLGLRGTPVLYQGDEIGLRDVAVEPPDLRDPLGVKYWPAYAGRDAMRTPMPWRDAPGAGFTEPESRRGCRSATPIANVEQQRPDPTSMLVPARDLIALRKRTPDLERRDLHAAARAGRCLGVEPRRSSRGRRQPLGCECHDRSASRDACSSAPTGPVTARTSRAALQLRAWEGCVVATE